MVDGLHLSSIYCGLRPHSGTNIAILATAWAGVHVQRVCSSDNSLKPQI